MRKSILTIVHATQGHIGTNPAVAAALDADWAEHHVLVVDATSEGCLDARALSRADDERMAWIRAESLRSTSAVLRFAILAFQHPYVTVQQPDRVCAPDKLQVQWNALHLADDGDSGHQFGATAALPPPDAMIGNGAGALARTALATHATGALYRAESLRSHLDVVRSGMSDVQLLDALARRGVTCRWHEHQPWQSDIEVRPSTGVYTLPLYGMEVAGDPVMHAGVLVDAGWLDDMGTLAMTRRLL